MQGFGHADVQWQCLRVKLHKLLNTVFAPCFSLSLVLFTSAFTENRNYLVSSAVSW